MSDADAADTMLYFAAQLESYLADPSPSSEPPLSKPSDVDLAAIAALLRRGARALNPPDEPVDIPGVGRVSFEGSSASYFRDGKEVSKHEYEIPAEPGKIRFRTRRADGTMFESSLDKIRNADCNPKSPEA